MKILNEAYEDGTMKDYTDMARVGFIEGCYEV